MKKIVSLLVLMIVACTAVIAQTEYTMGVGVTDVTTCNAIIYDNGGASGNYGAGRDDWMTIYPSSGAVAIILDEFDVATTDTLFIYNGTDPNNDTIPFMIGSLATNWVNNDNAFVQGDLQVSATIQNPTGAITLHFVSAANSQGGGGFKLTVSCAEPCQRIYANIDFENSVPTPHFDTELNDGYYYVDFCPGDTIHIAAYATYPDNDFSYHQDATTTYFDWSFGQSGNGQTDLYYVFNEGQGYDLTLSLRDQHNGNTCYGQQPVAIRVRGSRDPFRNASLLEDVCQGTEIPLLISMDSAANIIVEPVGSTQESSLSVDSTVFIPDGPNCSLGTQCFSSSVNFTAFPPGATITSASDILAVRINMEHSYIGDISIALKCPNNRSALIMEQPCGANNSRYFGQPYGYDSHGTYDETQHCDAAHNPAGTGWNYCWSENSSYAQIASGYCYNHLAGGQYSSSIDSSNVANRTNYYAPYQSFSNLIGCPLNGLWQIEVCDMYGIDNGYIFSWELSLDPSLMPQDWTYSVNLTEISWTGGHIVPTSDSTASIMTDDPGDYNYIFTLIDEYGCEYPHNMPLKVVQQPEFTLTSQYICEGETATLDPEFEYVGTPGLIEYVWTDSATATNIGSNSTINIGQNGTYSLCINTFNNDHSLTCTKCDTAEVIFNPQPIVNFSASILENCSPLNTNLTPNITYTDGLPHTDDVTLTYLWTITDSYGNEAATSNQANPSFSLQDAGVYTVTLYVETQNGCHDSRTMTDYLTVYAQPISDFLSNPERTNLGEGGTIAFINITDTSVFAANDNIHWTWNYGEGDDTYDLNGEHTYTQWGEYTVTLSVITDQGCQSTVSHVVYIEADLIFPNIITPNGDGKNDVFAIKNMNPLMPNVLSIYDRWGKKVYEKQNYQTYAREGDQQIYNESDGFTADKLSDGVYYYTFHYEGYTKAVDYHGTLTIIRDK
ncbi:MAG: gliding motility-associated C-terminal domain-containing protein [Bacteroidales bacterium]|nr:gliding motility-associated C-terminal domain-containing protein [Bacteroidales bacterium]